MRPVITGRQYAVSSMKHQATEAAVRILEAGGNAFDAAVAGQAVLALVHPGANGFGSDAMILVYDAKAKKVSSINAGGPAPKLATIDWYKKNNDNKLPDSDGLLAGTVPGVIDAWSILLDRWGTMSFEQVLQPAIEIAEQGFVLDAGPRALDGVARAGEVPDEREAVPTGRPAVRRRRSLQESRRRPASPQADRGGERCRGHRPACPPESRARSLLQGRHRANHGRVLRTAGGAVPLRGLCRLHRQVETPVSTTYRGYEVYKNPSANQGPAELFALNMLEGFDLRAMGLNSADYIHTSAEAVKLAMGDREKYLGDMDFITIPYEGLLSKGYAAERRKLIDPARASRELLPGNPSQLHEPRRRPSSTIRTTPRSRGMPRTTATRATWRSWTRIATW